MPEWISWFFPLKKFPKFVKDECSSPLTRHALTVMCFRNPPFYLDFLKKALKIYWLGSVLFQEIHPENSLWCENGSILWQFERYKPLSAQPAGGNRGKERSCNSDRYSRAGGLGIVVLDIRLHLHSIEGSTRGLRINLWILFHPLSSENLSALVSVKRCPGQKNFDACEFEWFWKSNQFAISSSLRWNRCLLLVSYCR